MAGFESQEQSAGHEDINLEITDIFVPSEIFTQGTEHEFVKRFISRDTGLPASRIIIAGIEETGLDIIFEKKETFGIFLKDLFQTAEEDPLTYGNLLIA